jgi:spore maturation protein CgeB
MDDDSITVDLKSSGNQFNDLLQMIKQFMESEMEYKRRKIEEMNKSN